MLNDAMFWDTAWQIVNGTMIVGILTALLHGIYRSMKHRITRGIWPKTRNERLADEIDRDLERMFEEGNPAVPGTLAYESRRARESREHFEDAYRNMNPL